MICVNFAVPDCHIMPLSRCEFHEDWYIEMHTLLEGNNEILLLFYTSLVRFL